MKRILSVLLVLVLLAGCGSSGSELDRMLEFRQQLLNSNGCKFDAVITADYGEKIYTFTMVFQRTIFSKNQRGIIRFWPY